MHKIEFAPSFCFGSGFRIMEVKAVFFFLLFVVSGSHIQGQFQCFTSQDAKFAEYEEAFNQYVLDFRDQGLHLDTGLKYIPTVFHIIMRDAADSLSVERVMSQVQATNTDLRRLNADTVNTREDFRAVAADLHVEVCPATRDTLGRTFEGVIWHHVPGYAFDSLNVVVSRTILNPDRYLNVWVCPYMNGGLASMPWQKEGDWEGIRLGVRYFGTIGDSLDPLYNLGRIFTHELGHYLGLYHTFHESDQQLGNCDFLCGDTTGDRCADTPLDWSFFPFPGEECAEAERYCDEDTYFYAQTENYMFYNRDSCMNMFSSDQRIRVRASLHDLRAKLVSEENLIFTGACAPPLSVKPPVSPLEMNIYPNPANDKLFVKISNTPIINAEVCIYDIAGQRLHCHKATGREFAVDISMLPKGLYLLTLTTNNNAISQKFIREP